MIEDHEPLIQALADYVLLHIETLEEDYFYDPAHARTLLVQGLRTIVEAHL
jgi:hypothetical protein